MIGLARGVSLLLGVMLLAVLGRRLGTEGFGTLQFALAVMAYPVILVDLGLTTFGLREIARGTPVPGLLPRVIGARLVLSTVSLIVVVTAALVLPLQDEFRTTLVILGLGLPASALNARWVLQGERRFVPSALVEVAATGTQLIAVVALVHGADDAPAAAGALTFAAWMTTTASLVLAGRISRFRPMFGSQVPATIRRSLPLGAAAIAITIYYSFDTVLLGIFRGGEEVAYYAAAYRVILPILTLAGAVGIVAIPNLSFLVGQDAGAANKAVARLSHQMVLWALPMAVGGAFAAAPIIDLVYGPAFAPAVVPFQILVLSVATVYGNAPFAFLLLARGGDRRYLTAVAMGAGANIGLNLLVIPVAGMVGAALVTIASEVTVLALLVWWTRDVSRTALTGALRRTMVPTLVMALVVWPIRSSILAIPAAAITFGLVAVVTGLVPAATLARWFRLPSNT